MHAITNTDAEDSDLPTEREGNRPVWYRAAHCAPTLGFTVDLLLSAIEAGQLPIRAQQFGVRGLWFLNSADVLAYLGRLTEESPT